MMESFDSEAISSIDLQIKHVFNENWRIYLLRDLESMYSVFCTMASALRKYSIYSCVFYFYSTCRGIICTEIWRVLQQCEYCRFWHAQKSQISTDCCTHYKGSISSGENLHTSKIDLLQQLGTVFSSICHHTKMLISGVLPPIFASYPSAFAYPQTYLCRSNEVCAAIEHSLGVQRQLNESLK